ncbi:hypothetical protein LXL04_035969 [Taraxacum kok-saghyz]
MGNESSHKKERSITFQNSLSTSTFNFSKTTPFLIFQIDTSKTTLSFLLENAALEQVKRSSIPSNEGIDFCHQFPRFDQTFAETWQSNIKRLASSSFSSHNGHKMLGISRPILQRFLLVGILFLNNLQMKTLCFLGINLVGVGYGYVGVGVMGCDMMITFEIVFSANKNQDLRHGKMLIEDDAGGMAVQMRTIIGGGNGGTNLGHLFHFAADQFFDAGALLSAQHM